MCSAHLPLFRNCRLCSTFSACGLGLDIWRQCVTDSDFYELLEVAREKRGSEADAAMREGQIVNASEGRSALHTAQRDPVLWVRPITRKCRMRSNTCARLPTTCAQDADAVVGATRSPTSSTWASAVRRSDPRPSITRCPKLISDFRLGNGREFLGIEAI